METSSAAPPAAAAKPNRSRRNNNNNHSKRRGKPRGPPPAPLLKLVLRNFSSLDDMMEQVPRMMEAAGAAMDVQQLRDHIVAEREFAAATAAWKEQVQKGTLEEEGKKEEGDDEEDGGEEPAEKETKELENGKEKHQQNNLKNGAAAPPSLETTVPPGTLVVRVMYIVAPRVSRRRGSILGSVYIVLTITANPEKADDRNAAQARLRLQTALDQLQTSVASSTVVVQEARSAKAWKDTRRFGNETGTIFETADYKQWLETTTAATSELSSRPKPVPGGVTHTAATAAAPPVAALVTYLQNKRSTERRKAKPSRNNATAAASTIAAATKKRERNRRPRRKKRKPAATTTTTSGS